MKQAQDERQSQLFTLRVWVEDVGDACTESNRSSRSEIRGTLKHVLTGETTHFRDWDMLIQIIEDVFEKQQVREKKR